MERIFLTKYIIITGGVVSSIGKGITSASMGRILRSYGLKVSAIKIDPYLNCGIQEHSIRTSTVRYL